MYYIEFKYAYSSLFEAFSFNFIETNNKTL